MNEIENAEIGVRNGEPSEGRAPAPEFQSDERQLVVFRLLEEEFGVEIENVKEIVRLPDITPIPRSPDYVAGICNLRGNVLPVIDTPAPVFLGNRGIHGSHAVAGGGVRECADQPDC